MITRRTLLTSTGLSLAWLGAGIVPSTARPKFDMECHEDRLAAAKEIEKFIFQITGKKWTTLCPRKDEPLARAFLFHEDRTDYQRAAAKAFVRKRA